MVRVACVGCGGRERAVGEGGSSDALERAYACYATRLRAAAAVSHPAAPLFLELESPAEWLAGVQREALSVGLRCDTCSAVRSAETLHACSGCGAARYCGTECQRKDWRGGHKALCALLRGGGGGGGGGGGLP